MRFGVPRSPSPSPVRRQAPRRRPGFGIPRNRLESDSDSDTESVASTSSSSSDSFAYDSESQVPISIKPKRGRPSQTAEEQYFIEDTIASIRLRVKYRDAYEDWEYQTRKDAFVTARHEQSASTAQRRRSQMQSQSHEDSRVAALHTKQMEEVQAQLMQFKLVQDQREVALKEKWDRRSRNVWNGCQEVIAAAEEKVKEKLAEEAARRKAEEEAKAKLVQAKKEREERERKAAEEKKQAEEEEKKAQQLKQETDAKLQAQEQEKQKLGVSSTLEDWQRARASLLQKLKSNPMRIVKADKARKSAWSAARRQIVTKVGQLNNDAQRTIGIAREIVSIIMPNPRYPEELYCALLSSLAKAILRQAEVEVTAEKKTAVNLALLSTILLAELEFFGEVFWAKLVQRTGGWAIPVVIPAKDIDGSDIDKDQAKRRKVMGYSDAEETNAEYAARVAGIMRVYFQIIANPHPKMLHPIFGRSRYWTYCARMAKEPQLLLSSVGPELLFVALEVGGAQARHTWGAQWVKLLGMLYAGAIEGIKGSKEHLIGGSSPEGIAARTRVQLEIERIMSQPPT
ncbi:hypothetical protein EIP91_002519 [Steccherinum ochraceum]|uniref:mRNA export factor GLE1 n=1 Tax=Steccherinum ochraceum TaxID=92696 RepID=A0A4R0RIE0_9APHY|nr:hypothetical protein EIP91_002519 [Steccherinum ochraceum]